MNILKSIGAILAGILANVVLAIGTDAILVQSGIAPPFNADQPWPATWLLIAVIYRTLYGIVGGYFTAIAAPKNPMKHVMVLGIVGTLANIGGLVAYLNKPDAWYPILLVITAFPASWIGGKLKENSKRS